jgi:hypothetical protein
MAQIQEQSIMLANRGVGKVSINGGGIRGEGGALHPQLVVPMKFDLGNFPAEAMLAVYRVKATLAAEQHPYPGNALCRPTAEDLIDNFPVHSLPQGDISRSVDLRFWLSSAEVENIETIRHKSPTSTFILHVAVEAGIAWVKTYNQMGQTAQPDSPWEMNFGMFSQLYPFWTCRIATIQVEIDQSHWIDNVLPGLGYDCLRLLELTFPPSLPDHPNAAAQFDQARNALDQRRYGDCISACRGLLKMWEKQYGSNSKQRIAELVAADRQWPEGDIRRSLLDVLWKEVLDIANAPHHPEGSVTAEIFDGRDARLLLLLTSALSEYVERR